jgi:hypothetical protein
MSLASTTITPEGREIRSRLRLAAAVLVAVAAVGWLVSRSARSEIVTGPDGSLFVTDLNGTAALGELLERRGVTITPAVTPMTDLDGLATILLLDPNPRTPYGPAEVAALDRFVEDGGTAVITGFPHPDLIGTFLPADLGFDYSAEIDSPVRFPLGGVGGTVESAGLRNLRTDDPSLPLVGDRAVVAVFPHGAGLVIYAADGSIFHNRRIARNAPWAVSVLGSGPLLADEVRHGFEVTAPGENPIGLLGSLPPAARRTLLLLLAAGAVGLVAYGRRWTPVERRDRQLKPARLELVEAVGGLMLRTGEPLAAAEPLVRRLETIVRRALRIAADTPLDPAAIAPELGVAPDQLAIALNPGSEDDLLVTHRTLTELHERMKT